VYAFGRNTSYQLGNNKKDPTPTIIECTRTTRYANMACGLNHSCIISEICKTNSLSASYRSLLNSKRYSDIIFLIGDKRIHAHRCILSIRSEYFYKLLEGAMKEKVMPEIKLEEQYESFMLMIEYLYTDTI